MPSGPVAESESRFDSKLSTLSEERDTGSRDSYVRLGKVGTESDGFQTQDFDANTKFRHSAFSRAVSAVLPFEVREGMEAEHTPETDLIRRHQDLEEGERFESYQMNDNRQAIGGNGWRLLHFPPSISLPATCHRSSRALHCCCWCGSIFDMCTNHWSNSGRTTPTSVT